MTRQAIQLEPFKNVGSGQRATLDLTNQVRMHGLQLKYAATLAAGTVQVVDGTAFASAFSEVKLMVGNKAQRTYSGESLVMLHQFAGRTLNNGYIHIPFSEMDRRTINGEESLAWGTANLEDPAVRLQVTLGTVYNPELSAVLEQDDVQADMGAIVKIQETNYNLGAGWNTITPDFKRLDKFRRIHIKDSGDITEFEVKVNGRTEMELTAIADNTERLKQSGPPGQSFVPQTNWTHIVFDTDKRVLSNLDTVRPGADGALRPITSMQLRLNCTAGGNFTVVEERIGLPD